MKRNETHINSWEPRSEKNDNLSAREDWGAKEMACDACDEFYMTCTAISIVRMFVVL
jgi:hypothetical protein